jgi:hypothetical protein
MPQGQTKLEGHGDRLAHETRGYDWTTCSEDVPGKFWRDGSGAIPSEKVQGRMRFPPAPRPPRCPGIPVRHPIARRGERLSSPALPLRSFCRCPISSAGPGLRLRRGSSQVAARTPLKIQRKYSGPLLPTHAPFMFVLPKKERTGCKTDMQA